MSRAFRLRFDRDHRLVAPVRPGFACLIAISMMDLAAKS
jgi:hypothetical protein